MGGVVEGPRGAERRENMKGRGEDRLAPEDREEEGLMEGPPYL